MSYGSTAILLRCWKCRKFVTDSACIINNEECIQSPGILKPSTCRENCNIWHLEAEASPDWVKKEIEKEHWTSGKLYCPYCRTRLGAFNFVDSTKCSCGRLAAVRLCKSKIDVDIAVKTQCQAPSAYKLSTRYDKKFRHGMAEYHHRNWITDRYVAVPGTLVDALCLEMPEYDKCFEERGKKPCITFSVKTHNSVLRDGIANGSRNVLHKKSSSFDLDTTEILPLRSCRNNKETFTIKPRPSESPLSSSDSSSWNNTYNIDHTLDVPPRSAQRRSRVSETCYNTASPGVLHLEQSTGQSLPEESIPTEWSNNKETFILKPRPSEGPLSGSDSSRRNNTYNIGHTLDITPRSAQPRLRVSETNHNPAGSGFSRLQQNIGQTLPEEPIPTVLSTTREESVMTPVEVPQQVTQPPLPSANQRLNKREINRLKNLRRKQKRREKWLLGQKQINKSHHIATEEDEELLKEKESYTCAVCLDVYFQPYTCHPCRHVFCEPCLRTLARDNPTRTPCPLCRSIITRVHFHSDLSKCSVAFFPNDYLKRKQSFQRANCAKWPLPHCNSLFRVFGDFGRRMDPIGRRQFPHGEHRLDFEDESRGWRFDLDMIIIYIYSVNWVIGFIVFFLLCYFFFL
ncbi:hypothetical protein GDO81_002734 [Engystomops pustulosus]|uniref:E3 ubiquitin-protein ligase RNF180 n=1 Tax=Engystomops pustulosus TaxID=76066 RepID=A0AAV7DP21_ENGPU|nr:hypothetical protein GDO81_002734 [Engystomops pustulosus]KAG8598771.1 hypothetical protein GDO81_002734 [Engystomops pustulosus]